MDAVTSPYSPCYSLLLHLHLLSAVVVIHHRKQSKRTSTVLNTSQQDQSPAAVTQQEFAGLTESALRVAVQLGVAFHILLASAYFFVRWDVAWLQQFSGAAITVAILGCAAYLLHSGRVPTKYLYPLATFLFLIPMLANQWLNFYVSQNQNLLVGIVMIMLLSGYLLLDRIWLGVSVAVSLVGWLVTYALANPEGLTPNMTLLTIAVGVVSVVLHLWRRHDVDRMVRLCMEKQEVRQLARNLHKSGQAVAQSLEKEAVLVSILDNLTEILPCNRASVMLKNGDYLDIVASLGFPPYDEPEEAMRIFIGDAAEDGIFPKIYHTQQSLHVSNVAEREDWVQFPQLIPAKVWLGTPLIHNHEVVGMFSITRVDPIPYTAQEIEHAELFASQAAVAVQNALLYERVTQLNHEMETQVQERTQDLQEAYYQLEKLDQAKTDFISVMSHELRTPLTVLSGYAQILAQYEKIRQDDVARDLVDGVRLGAVRLQELVNSLLDMVKLENGSLEVIFTEFVPIAACQIVMSKLNQIVETRHLEMRIDSSVQALPPIVADYELMQKVIQHLLLNAVKYTPDGGLVEIKGELSSLNGRAGAKLIVRDTGIGIDKGMQSLIFKKFYQTGKINLHSSSQTRFKGGGAGLGLPLTKGIIDLHEGEIWVESEGHDEDRMPGSEFHIWLPLSGV